MPFYCVASLLSFKSFITRIVEKEVTKTLKQ